MKPRERPKTSTENDDDDDDDDDDVRRVERDGLQLRLGQRQPLQTKLSDSAYTLLKASFVRQCIHSAESIFRLFTIHCIYYIGNKGSAT